MWTLAATTLRSWVGFLLEAKMCAAFVFVAHTGVATGRSLHLKSLAKCRKKYGKLAESSPKRPSVIVVCTELKTKQLEMFNLDD